MLKIILLYLQVDSLADPVILNSLVQLPGPDGFYILSAASIARTASAHFNTALSSQHGNAKIVEHFPAFTFQMEAFGPNGMQLYEVNGCVMDKEFDKCGRLNMESKPCTVW